MMIPAGILQRFSLAAQNLAAQASLSGMQPDGLGQRSLTGVDGTGSGGIGAVDGASFGDTLKRALAEVSASQDGAQAHVNAFLRGDPVELHQVMAATEEAGIALEMLIEVRNKFTEAYRTVINMQS